jgi:hypothetical protein
LRNPKKYLDVSSFSIAFYVIDIIPIANVIGVDKGTAVREFKGVFAGPVVIDIKPANSGECITENARIFMGDHPGYSTVCPAAHLSHERTLILYVRMFLSRSGHNSVFIGA